MMSTFTTKHKKEHKKDIRNCTSYSKTEVSNELNQILQVLSTEEKEWKEELLHYEEGGEIAYSDAAIEENDINDGNKRAFNDKKFPYEKTLQDLVIEVRVRVRVRARVRVRVLVPQHRRTRIEVPLEPTSKFLDKWESELLSDLSKSVDVCDIITIVPSIPSLEVLLRLLRYATSYICYDYVLARALLLLLWECRSLYSTDDGRTMLRRLLVILKMNYEYNCRGTCEEEALEALANGYEEASVNLSGHCCVDVKAFYNTLSLVLLLALSEECNLTLIAFVTWEYGQIHQAIGLHSGTDLASDVAGTTIEQNPSNSGTIYNRRREYSDSSSDDSDDDNDNTLPFITNELICTKIIIAVIQSRRVRHSFIRTLHDITTLTVKFIVSNPLNQSIGAALITSFLSIFSPKNTFKPTAMDFTRYADLLLHPPFQQRVQMSKELYSVIRALYYLDLIDIPECRCGYGDFLVWTGYVEGIHPHDRLLFIHVDNYFLNDEMQHEITDDILIDTEASARYDFSLMLLIKFWMLPWSPNKHYTFSKLFQQASITCLLSLNSYLPKDILINHILPFFPRCHFQPFGKKASTPVLTLTRPVPDERLECWYNKCQLRHINNKPQQSQIFLCGKCGIMPCCGQAHYKKLYKSYHKGVCGSPPFRIPGTEEEVLCQTLIGINDTLKPTLIQLFPRIVISNETLHEEGEDKMYTSDDNQGDKINEDDDDDDDDGDWESVPIDEEELQEYQPNEVTPLNVTDLLTTFFEEKSAPESYLGKLKFQHTARHTSRPFWS